MVVLFLAVCGSGAASAQTGGSAETRWYGTFDLAATLGHNSSWSIGGEGGYRLRPEFDVFFEAGHMANVGTSDLDQRANLIASNFAGGTASASYKVGYYVGGIRYNINRSWALQSAMLHPYAIVGLGGAHVRADTTISAPGLPPGSITFGSDLNGVENKFLFVLGGGVTSNFGQRYLVDLSYRFGHIAPSSDIENDQSINTQRVQVGVGVRF
jgi:opacity protein-like surface antigen